MDTVLEQSAKLLGMRRKIKSSIDLHDAIVAGFNERQITRVKKVLHINNKNFAKLLGISERTLSRKKQWNDISDRLYRLVHVFALANTVFEDSDRARQWLNESQKGLGWKVPFELMSTEPGSREVEDLLGRIEYSVVS